MTPKVTVGLSPYHCILEPNKNKFSWQFFEQKDLQSKELSMFLALHHQVQLYMKATPQAVYKLWAFQYLLDAVEIKILLRKKSYKTENFPSSTI